MIEEVHLAHQRIQPYINKTPIFTSRTINRMLGARIFFKCENFQRVGAFKARGAFNALVQLIPTEKETGVITHSSGNHAQAVALASRELGIPATVVMPKNAPTVKVRATAEYGANIIRCGNKPMDRKETVDELIKTFNYTLIHPYDDLRIIFGAGTASLELINQTKKDLDLIIAPVGGGGLLSGTSIVSAANGIEVLGAEPMNADDAYKSLKDGTKIFPSINPNTIADGLRTSLGSLTFQIIKENVKGIIRVTEEEIIQAMKLLWERMKLVVEPSGSVPLAALMVMRRNGEIGKNERIGVILSGGNIDLTEIFTLLGQRMKIS